MTLKPCCHVFLCGDHTGRDLLQKYEDDLYLYWATSAKVWNDIQTWNWWKLHGEKASESKKHSSHSTKKFQNSSEMFTVGSTTQNEISVEWSTVSLWILNIEEEREGSLQSNITCQVPQVPQGKSQNACHLKKHYTSLQLGHSVIVYTSDAAGYSKP